MLQERKAATLFQKNILVPTNIWNGNVRLATSGMRLTTAFVAAHGALYVQDEISQNSKK
jgi:hypothetical protein